MIELFVLEAFEALGLRGSASMYTAYASLIVALALLMAIAGFILKGIVSRILRPIIKRTKTGWDDILYHRGVFTKMVPLLSWLLLALFSPVLFSEESDFGIFAIRMTRSILSALIILSLGIWLDGLNAIYETKPLSRQRPLKGYVQLVQIFLYAIAGIIVVTALMDVSPVAILSGFGAMSAVLLLVFKDTLLGLVSGVQLSSNDMVRLGDWIEMPKYGADGDVVDINLQTVKVRNWDMTITTIPIYALISDSFKNWRGMSESGGRRIMRSILIDAATVSFLSPEQIQEFSGSELLGPYMAAKTEELAKDPGCINEQDPSRRRLTNIGTFRAYMGRYIEKHPGINQEMIHMVRQLQPTSDGIPLQIYAFTRDKAWVVHETVQSDIMDHLLAVIPRFGLRVYQHPSGGDVREMARLVGGFRQ
jgi:miniconductance mechanosensitive channel